jgi:hypothetical protein
VNSLRFWILVASVTWFISGLATGLLVSGAWKKPAPEANPVAHYTNRMITEFDMQPERARLFRLMMDEYQGEKESLKEQHMAQQASEMEPELRRLGERYNTLIRERVLSRAQREHFDRLSSVLP